MSYMCEEEDIALVEMPTDVGHEQDYDFCNRCVKGIVETSLRDPFGAGVSTYGRGFDLRRKAGGGCGRMGLSDWVCHVYSTGQLQVNPIRAALAMKQYPIEFECRKRIDFWPEKPAVCRGDILEVGPGRGDLLMHMAQAHPDKRFVAIEIGKRRFLKLIPRILKRNIKNIQLIGGNARVVLPLYYRSDVFEQAYVLFPDPWPKKRHIPHRLLSVSFMTLVARSLRVGGDFFVATDVADYADWVLENASQMEFLELARRPTLNEPLIDGYIPTFFEAKWREMGRDIHYQHYRKVCEITEPLDGDAKKVVEILGEG